jgi:hypothetical protein
MDSGSDPDLCNHISQSGMLVGIGLFLKRRESEFQSLGVDNAIALQPREISQKINGALLTTGLTR